MKTTRMLLGALVLACSLLALSRPAAAWTWPWSQSDVAKTQRIDRIERNAGVVNGISIEKRKTFDAIMATAKQLATAPGVAVQLRFPSLLDRLKNRPSAAEIRHRGSNALLGTLSIRRYNTGTAISQFVFQGMAELKLAQPNKPDQAVSYTTRGGPGTL